MAIVTILAYARSRANTSLRSAAMRLSRMLGRQKNTNLIKIIIISNYNKGRYNNRIKCLAVINFIDSKK